METPSAAVRTIWMPAFTPEQIAHLNGMRAPARSRPYDGRVGGIFTGPWPRHDPR